MCNPRAPLSSVLGPFFARLEFIKKGFLSHAPSLHPRRRRIFKVAQISRRTRERFIEHLKPFFEELVPIRYSWLKKYRELKKFRELCGQLQDKKQNAQELYHERRPFIFPHEGRTLIEESAIIQNVYQYQARAGLRSLNLRLHRKHLMRIFQASPRAAGTDWATPDLKLGEPVELVSSANKHVRLRSVGRNVSNENAQASLRSSGKVSAACSSGLTPHKPSSRPSTKFQVFISHAGEDKSTIAVPLREMLRDLGIKAFVDEKDMPPGGDAKEEMVSAMETAQLGIIVLSPEFVARGWPVKELLCFLRRRREAILRRESYPIVIPMFYRLSIADLYKEPQLDRRRDDGTSLYESSRFFERQARGEPEADISTIQNALRELHGITGVRNDIDASNASSHLMYTRREMLLKLACDKIVEALAGSHNGIRNEDTNQLEQQTSQRRTDLSARTRQLSIWQLRIFKLRSAYERKVLDSFNCGCRRVTFILVKMIMTCKHLVVWPLIIQLRLRKGNGPSPILVSSSVDDLKWLSGFQKRDSSSLFVFVAFIDAAMN